MSTDAIDLAQVAQIVDIVAQILMVAIVGGNFLFSVRTSRRVIETGVKMDEVHEATNGMRVELEAAAFQKGLVAGADAAANGGEHK